MNVAAIDPGQSPGYCASSPEGWLCSTQFVFGARTFDLAIVEWQTVATGVTRHKGRAFKAHHKTVPTLSMTAGWQLAQVNAKRYIAIEPKHWRGLLWDDGALGLYGLAGEAAIARLRTLQPALAGHTDDEVEAYGLMLAGEAIGNATKGVLRDGRPWRLKKQVWGYSFDVPNTAKRNANALVKDLLARKDLKP